MQKGPRLKQSQIEGMKVIFTNADQMTPSKKSELLKYVEKIKPLVIAVCEMKPKNARQYELQDHQIPGYTLHPVNIEPGSKGRGIAVYSHNSLDKSIIQIQPELSFDETCLLEIKLRGNDILLFGCFYRSPTETDTSDENNTKLNSLLKALSNKKYSHYCILGDFNYRHIDWDSNTTIRSENSRENQFIETTRDCFWHQHIREATRRRGQDEASLIDLLLTNEPMQVSNLVHQAPLGKSDHSVISFTFHCYLDFSKAQERFNYNKADYQGMRNYIQNNKWNDTFTTDAESKTKDELWDDLKSTIHDLRDRFVPKTVSDGKPAWKTTGNIPIDKPTQDAIRKKTTLHRKWMRAKNRADADVCKLDYSRANNKVKKLIRKAKRRFERSICLGAKSNPKSFWWYVRHKLKTKPGVAPLLENPTDRDSMKFKDKEKADILQKQFSGVFIKEMDSEVPKISKRTKCFISNLLITKAMVREVILQLNKNKAFGPDEIHPRILIELVDVLSGPLTLLFNKTLEDGNIPHDWKKAVVSPIFKKGSKNNAENYRPISLTSIICKLMETLVKNAVLAHLISEKLLSTSQYGFMSGKSTTTQLLKYFDKCCEIIASGGVVDTIYLDFQKAFDTVPHRRLIGKLDAYGISGNILDWIKGFLTERSQIVKVNGVESFPAPVISGIPQGSVLGPLLFLIYINDLPDAVKSYVLLFADDTKIFRCVASESDAKELQEDIDSLQNWSDKWLLRFHPDKCHVLTLGKLENIKFTKRYTILQQELEHVDIEKDLGVSFDSNLTFEQHISAKVNKANSIVGLIRRSFTYLDCKLFKKLYTTFVRPHLEYGQAVWSPHLRKHINLLENVQIRATKLVDGLSKLTYEERLKKLDLPSLVYRRARGDMIEVFRHIHSHDQNSLPPNFNLQNRCSRNHDFQLRTKKPLDGERGIQSNSFYFRVSDKWNNLPKNVVNAKTINEFKNRLDDAWKNKPTKYNPSPVSDS